MRPLGLFKMNYVQKPVVKHHELGHQIKYMFLVPAEVSKPNFEGVFGAELCVEPSDMNA